MSAWCEKLNKTAMALEQSPELAIVFGLSKSGAPEEFLQVLQTKYCFIDADYLQFLRMTDGAHIDSCVLRGSGSSSFPSISEAISIWHGSLGGPNDLPIGEDYSSRCIAMNFKGQILLYEHNPSGPQPPTLLASCFAEFLDEIVMGHEYDRLYSGIDDNDQWIAYLKQQGWK